MLVGVCVCVCVFVSVCCASDTYTEGDLYVCINAFLSALGVVLKNVYLHVYTMYVFGVLSVLVAG